MKERAFFRLMVTSVVAMVVAVLLPVQALAAICFQDQFGDIFVIEAAAQKGQFFSLVGEFIGAAGGLTPAGTSFPLAGSAHLRPDGKGHFGVTVHVDDFLNLPFWVQGTLDPPFFTSGSGGEDDLFGGFNFLTFSPAACPALPQ